MWLVLDCLYPPPLTDPNCTLHNGEEDERVDVNEAKRRNSSNIKVGRWQGVMRNDQMLKWERQGCLPLAAKMSCLGPQKAAPAFTCIPALLYFEIHQLFLYKYMCVCVLCPFSSIALSFSYMNLLLLDYLYHLYQCYIGSYGS